MGRLPRHVDGDKAAELNQVLPLEYAAEPRVYLGTYYEIDECGFELDEPRKIPRAATDEEGGVATLAWAPPEPTLVLETDLLDEYAYEVLVHDRERGRTLVAAIEIVSPANKDRKASRKALATKCAALLQ